MNCIAVYKTPVEGKINSVKGKASSSKNQIDFSKKMDELLGKLEDTSDDELHDDSKDVVSLDLSNICLPFNNLMMLDDSNEFTQVSTNKNNAVNFITNLSDEIAFGNGTQYLANNVTLHNNQTDITGPNINYNLNANTDGNINDISESEFVNMLDNNSCPEIIAPNDIFKNPGDETVNEFSRLINFEEAGKYEQVTDQTTNNVSSSEFNFGVDPNIKNEVSNDSKNVFNAGDFIKTNSFEATGEHIEESIDVKQLSDEINLYSNNMTDDSKQPEQLTNKGMQESLDKGVPSTENSKRINYKNAANKLSDAMKDGAVNSTDENFSAKDKSSVDLVQKTGKSDMQFQQSHYLLHNNNISFEYDKPTNASAAIYTKPFIDAVSNQIIQYVTHTANDGKNELVLELKPEFLGKMNIRLVSEKDGIVAKIKVSNDDLKELLNMKSMQIQDVLKNQGIDMKEIELSSYDSNNNPDLLGSYGNRHNDSHREKEPYFINNFIDKKNESNDTISYEEIRFGRINYLA